MVTGFAALSLETPPYFYVGSWMGCPPLQRELRNGLTQSSRFFVVNKPFSGVCRSHIEVHANRGRWVSLIN